jgi:hypothetical protein
VFPGLLALLAAIADSHGSHGVAFDALLAAVPLTAVASLSAFGGFLERRHDTLALVQALLWALGLVLLLLSCAVRSPATQVHALPPLAWSALMGALGIFALKAVLAAVPYLGSSTLRPAKP